MRPSLYFLAFLLLSPLLSTAQAPPQKNPLGDGPEVVAAGRKLYNSTCTECHGMDGAVGARAPELGGNRRYFRLTEGAIFDTIKHGIPGSAMPAFDLPDDDLWRIVAFIRNLRGVAADSNLPGNVEHGMQIFAGKGECQSCHMIQGHGGTLGPDLSSIGGQITLKRMREALTQDGPIARGYRPVKVIQKDGAIVEGVAKNEDSFSIQLLDAHGKLHLFDKSEVREVIHSKQSLMPHNYDHVLSAEELQDLLAMLTRQARTKVSIEQPGFGENGR